MYNELIISRESPQLGFLCGERKFSEFFCIHGSDKNLGARKLETSNMYLHSLNNNKSIDKFLANK